MSFKVEEHILVPRHEILKENEVEKLLAKYNITKEQLPKILTTDPCVRVLGAEKGQVLKITRKSLTAGTSISYRVVVEG